MKRALDFELNALSFERASRLLSVRAFLPEAEGLLPSVRMHVRVNARLRTDGPAAALGKGAVRKT